MIIRNLICRFLSMSQYNNYNNGDLPLILHASDGLWAYFLALCSATTISVCLFLSLSYVKAHCLLSG